MPEMPAALPIARTMRHCARGIAFAAKGDIPSAKASQQEFLAEKKRITAEGVVGNNKGADVTDVAEHLLAGEILYREGKVDEGLAELRKAVKLEDQLRYSEPPDWMHPVRHALGAALLKEGKPLEAENVYRQDLAKLPGNGWALYGLARSFEFQGKVDDAKRARKYFEQAWKDADIEINSSCFCQPGDE
jgi:tetratricopeptide (TPR) repeat protein